MNKNLFINQFSKNIKFNYTCFDRVIIRVLIDDASRSDIGNNQQKALELLQRQS